MSTLVEDRPMTFSSKLADLADVALRGLHATYGAVGGLPYTMQCRDGGFQPEGHSVRYALISLLGLGVAEPVVGPTHDLSDTLWHRIADSGLTDTLTAGDYGLGLWAVALHGRADTRFTARRALTELRRDPSRCDSVDLAWIVLGAEHRLQSGGDEVEATILLDEAKQHLLNLWSPDASLFYRHPRGGAVSSVSRRVVCFANQIYPLMALSVHATRTGCHTSRDVVARLTDNLCRLQGPLGQWWWLYDARDGVVVDGYPVYSVHQDGMALMGLLWAGHALDRDLSEHFDRSLGWVYGQNERNGRMVVDESGLILRDVHRAGVGRVQRMVEGTLHCCGKKTEWDPWRDAAAFSVNAECRPYHLGWVLYAAGLANLDPRQRGIMAGAASETPAIASYTSSSKVAVAHNAGVARMTSGPTATKTPPESTPEAEQVEQWRRLYEATADDDDWLVVHRWDYDESMANATAADIRAKLELSPQDRVLEVGCASGKKLSMVLHDEQPGYGFDLCEALVRRKDDLAHAPQRLNLGVAEAAKLPVQSDSFDKVFCYSVCQCFPSEAYAADVVREMLRACKPGGIVLWGDVLGELEKLRKKLVAARVPVALTDGMLWLLRPVGRLRHQWRHEDDGMIRRLFPRSFFHEAARGLACDVEFLEQHVDGRRFAATRYDVRFRKH